MPIQFDTYDQQKIDRIKTHLATMAEKGKAKTYEIYVDALKAVPRTDEPSEFDGYEDYMTADSEQIKIIIYNSALSPRNDQYVFVLKARNREDAITQGLNGFPARTFTHNSLGAWRENLIHKDAQSLEIAGLKKENAELRRELAEAEEYADTLAEAVEAAKANGNKIGGVHWGDVLSVAVEGLVRRNTHLLKKIPAVSGLAGIIEQDNQRTDTEPETNSEVTFKKKEETTIHEPVMSPQEQEFLLLFREMQKHFQENEIEQVLEILDMFSKDKSQITPVLELLQEGEEESEEETQQ